MAAIKSRASLMAVTAEVTAGTYVAPTLGTQFIAMQEGFSLTPNFEVLENAEIRAGIGVAQPIQGLEQPQGNLDHYVRHSGVEGQAPNYALLLKSLLGAQTTNSTQRVTTGTSSTVSLINLSAGGSDFARGFAVMVKNATYEIRPVHSVSGNDLTLGFNLNVAPNSAGIGMGKCVNFSPANTGHPTLSLTLYRGNGGAIEVLTGARISSATFRLQAGQLINASYAFQGVKYHYNPFVVTTANNKIALTTDNVTDSEVEVAVGVYRDPHELAAAIQTALAAEDPAETLTCVYSNTTGKFTIATSTSAVLSLLWKTGASGSDNDDDHIGTLIGFSDAADDTGSTSYAADNAITLTASLTPSYDSADPQAAKNNEVLIGDSTSTSCFCASSIEFTVTNEIQAVECICAESGVQEYIISRRTVEMKVTGLLTAYDVDAFKRYRSNADVRACVNIGSKSGGNWVPGACMNFYIPIAKVSAYQKGDNNGIATMEITVRPYMDSSGNGEFYINCL